MDVQLSKESFGLIDEQLRIGQYQNADAVMRAGLGSLAGEHEKFRAMLRDADSQFDRGEALPSTTAEALADSIIDRGTWLLNRKS